VPSLPAKHEQLGMKHLCAVAFGIEIYPYQERILEAAFSKRKITIRATTRAGKSYCMAMAAILRAVVLPNHRVGIIAPTHDKTRIIMNYIADLLASNPMFDDLVMLSTEGMTKLERLRKEVSKKRITFKNGSSIECLSVDLDSRGFGAMGRAFDTNIIDETDMIDDESYVKIFRMLLESPDSCLIEIGNPFSLAHFYRHHNDSEWEKIHITAEDCVAAGRLTAGSVQEQRKELTELEARVLLDADFPDEIEMAIFTKKAIDNATKKAPAQENEQILIGIDVARGGRDVSVITEFGVKGNECTFLNSQTMDTRDTMTIVGAAATRADAYKVPVEISVDCVNNASVLDRLKELGYKTQEFIAGRGAHDSKRFFNLKTEAAFRLADMMKAGQVSGIPEASRYVLQLRAWTYEIRSDRQLKLIDPEDKSPDYADSLLIALYPAIYHGMFKILVPKRGLQ